MKAVLCTTFGGPELLEVHDVPNLVPGADDVVIDVKACAANVTDLLVIQDKYQYRQQLPFVPGGEAAGIVRAVGSAVTTVAVGDRVLAPVRPAASPNRRWSGRARSARCPTVSTSSRPPA